MIRAFAVIFACLVAGEVVVRLLQLKLPASIIGLLLLFGLLQLGWAKVEWFRQMTDFLMQNLMLLLIPPCVALMNYLDLLAADFWPITLATIGSSILVLLASAATHELIRKRR